MLNDLLLQFGMESWKPVLTAVLLPPVPLLLLMLLGASLARRRPVWAWLLLLAGGAGIWLSSTTAVGEALQRQLLAPARALDPADLQQLQVRAAAWRGTEHRHRGARRGPRKLCAGVRRRQPDGAAMERLRYGLWLSRETGLPVAFSGGTGHAQTQGPSEAEIAAQIAAREFGRPLKWVEASSRDTRENAERSVALLRPAGVTRIVLVTHGWHMRRSLRAFEQAIAAQWRRHRPGGGADRPGARRRRGAAALAAQQRGLQGHASGPARVPGPVGGRMRRVAWPPQRAGRGAGPRMRDMQARARPRRTYHLHSSTSPS